jgi:hypothetical protein
LSLIAGGLLALFSLAPGSMPARDACSVWRITGYVGSEYPGLTYDESTTTLAALARGEQIAAASWDVPLGAYIEVEELGVWRVADRGMLGPHHLDLLVGSRAEAFELTGYRRACVLG